VTIADLGLALLLAAIMASAWRAWRYWRRRVRVTVEIERIPGPDAEARRRTLKLIASQYHDRRGRPRW
jgi:uncharacterized membrane protein